MVEVSGRGHAVDHWPEGTCWSRTLCKLMYHRRGTSWTRVINPGVVLLPGMSFWPVPGEEQLCTALSRRSRGPLSTPALRWVFMESNINLCQGMLQFAAPRQDGSTCGLVIAQGVRVFRCHPAGDFWFDGTRAPLRRVREGTRA